MAAASAVVSVSMGAMKPVLEKLANLMGDQYKKFKGLRKEVSFLKEELGAMSALLEKMDTADKLDPQDTHWRRDIIDMSYDIEDCIDDFMDRVGEAGDKVGILQKASHYLKTVKDRYRIANQIKKIKTRVIQASQRRERYKFDVCISSTTSVDLDPRLSAIYKDSATLVGIDTQKKELVKWAMNEEQQLKVTSIVGFGGLGKTTLANEVYREAKEHFNCKAFVTVSQKPDIIKLLNSISSQFGLYAYSHACETDLINSIRKHLEDKRYFIIVDYLWDTRAWNTISCAFPQNDHCSRVMVTTRNENVAKECCGNHGCIHKMKPLSEEDSRKLFFNRVFDSEDACPSPYTEVSIKILKKCGGLPLAIITVASILACQPSNLKKQWEYLQSCLATRFEENSNLEDMICILDLSYKCLPHHLKACFLYLGTYPEDHKTNRVELVRCWVAEGFVSCSPNQDVWDVAESYFNELANRSMIQPAYEHHDMMMSHCRVHDMMLELIVRRCREDNFLSLIDGIQLTGEEKDTVIRRLTIDLRGVKDVTTVMAAATDRDTSPVRSLNIIRDNWIQSPLQFNLFSNSVKFKFVRVLFLDINNLATTIDLTGISQLSRLRYLKVKGNGCKLVLPAQTLGLRLLETLDLSEIYTNPKLPDIVDVPCLSHLAMPSKTRLPKGIGKMKSLRTLCGFSPPTSLLESITGLGELTALSELELSCEAGYCYGCVALPRATWMAALGTSLEKLGNLKLLSMDFSYVASCADALLSPSFSPPFRNLEWLFLESWTFSSIPRWIGHLRSVRVLELGAKQILQEDVDMIGTRLTSLARLGLRIVHAPTERIVIGGSTGFTALKEFFFDCDGVSYLTFEAGAMPNLQALELAIHAHEWDKATPVGLQHLPESLMKFCVSSVYLHDPWARMESWATEAENALMKGVFQEVVDALPTRPAFSFDERLIRQMEEEDFLRMKSEEEEAF